MKKLIVLAVLLISAAVYSATGIVNHGQGGSATIESAAVAGQPTCAVGIRGAIFNVEGASGAADVFQVCLKDASNAYNWTTK